MTQNGERYRQSALCRDDNNALCWTVPAKDVNIVCGAHCSCFRHFIDVHEIEDAHDFFARMYFDRFGGDASDCRRLDEFGFVAAS